MQRFPEETRGEGLVLSISQQEKLLGRTTRQIRPGEDAEGKVWLHVETDYDE